VGGDVHNDRSVIAVADGGVHRYGEFSADLGVLERALRFLGDDVARFIQQPHGGPTVSQVQCNGWHRNRRMRTL
jgi:hypothetical protein